MAKIIDVNQFRAEHQEYVNIQDDARHVHQQLPPGRAKRFYDSDELSFVFEKNLILDLLNQPFTQFLRVYYGAIPDEYATHEKPVGTPTIILGAARRINPYTDIGTLYLEWPTGLNAGGTEI